MKRPSDLPVYLVLRIAIAAARVAPRPVALATGAGIGRLLRRAGLRRAVTDANLARAFPEHSAADRARLGRDVYAHFGRMTVDSMRMAAAGPAALRSLVDDVEAIELIERSLALGRGVLILTGHLGNWELAGAYLADRGYPVAAVVKVPANPYVAAHAERTRRALGIETILMHEAPTRVPAVLAAGKIVALVADQGAVRSDVFAPFFGVPTQTPAGPGLFAARTGCPVLFGALVAAPGSRYQLVGEVLDDTPGRDPAVVIPAVAARYRARLELMVRRWPAQYLWTHRLWKRRPPAPGAPGGR